MRNSSIRVYYKSIFLFLGHFFIPIFIFTSLNSEFLFSDIHFKFAFAQCLSVAPRSLYSQWRRISAGGRRTSTGSKHARLRWSIDVLCEEHSQKGVWKDWRPFDDKMQKSIFKLHNGDYNHHDAVKLKAEVEKNDGFWSKQAKEGDAKRTAQQG